MPRNQRLGKQLVLEFLDYLRFKIEQDKLTLEETESIAKTIENTLNLTGTADDLGVSEPYWMSSKTRRMLTIMEFVIGSSRSSQKICFSSMVSALRNT